MPSIILVDLLENKTLLQRVQKVMYGICHWWISIRFGCFCVSMFVACDRNYDWGQQKTQLWGRLLNFRVRMFVKSAVITRPRRNKGNFFEKNSMELTTVKLRPNFKGFTATHMTLQSCHIGLRPLNLTTLINWNSCSRQQQKPSLGWPLFLANFCSYIRTVLQAVLAVMSQVL